MKHGSVLSSDGLCALNSQHENLDSTSIFTADRLFSFEYVNLSEFLHLQWENGAKKPCADYFHSIIQRHDMEICTSDL